MPEEADLAPSWAAGVVRDGKDENTVPTEEVGRMLAGGQEGKMEILAEDEQADKCQRRGRLGRPKPAQRLRRRAKMSRDTIQKRLW